MPRYICHIHHALICWTTRRFLAADEAEANGVARAIAAVMVTSIPAVGEAVTRLRSKGGDLLLSMTLKNAAGLM